MAIDMLRYNYRTGVVKQKGSRKLWVAVPLIAVLGGAYLLVNVLSPSLQLPFDAPQDATAKKLVTSKPDPTQNRLYIPQINLDVPILEGDDESVLSRGTWHRQPDNGDPVDGGNFVLSANRFSLGMTPMQTRNQSPFYYVNQLNDGDQFYVDFEGTRYAYEVVKKYAVELTDVSIEKRSDQPKLTLYAYEPGGLQPGQEVIEAKPVGTIAWVNGAAKLQASRF